MNELDINTDLSASATFDKFNFNLTAKTNYSKKNTDYWKRTIEDHADQYIGVKIPDSDNVDW